MDFQNFVHRFDEGLVTESIIDELLAIVHPTDASAKDEHRSRVIVDGEIRKFQAVGLSRRAEDVWNANRLAESRLDSAPQPISDLPPEFEADIPDDVYDRPDYVPEIKSRVGIVQAVRTWGKTQAVIKDNKTEGVKVRCPFPHHVDNRPSAWVNTDKQSWYCGKCQIGGDVIDFYAAAKHGLAPNDFHRDKRFVQIIGEMAEELGIQIVSTLEGGFVVEAETSSWASNMPDPEEVEAVSVVVPLEVTPPAETQTIPAAEMYPDVDFVPPSAEASEEVTITEEDMLRGVSSPEQIDEEENDRLPSYDWRNLNIPEGTFLHSWMTQLTYEYNWIPEEFFLALGFQAIGMSCNHSSTTVTSDPISNSTLFILVGPSASGKSTAVGRLTELISRATGARRDESTGNGVRRVKSFASSEALLHAVKTQLVDVNDPTAPPTEVPTNAWYIEDEFATFVSRARRVGGGHVKQRVMELHDFVKRADHPEVASSDNSQTHGHRSVHDTFFTGTFLTQNDALRELVDSSDLVSGFLNRMNFWMGPQRNRQMLSSQVGRDPDPDFIKIYERMWKDCNLKKRIVPFSDAALLVLDTHRYRNELERLSAESSLFARWRMAVMRIAHMLAVNENVPLVEANHIHVAYDIVYKYLIPCGKTLVELASASRDDKDDLREKVVEWLSDQYDKTGQWPQKGDLTKNRWWRNTSDEIRTRVLDLAMRNSEITEATVADYPTPGKYRTVMLVPSHQSGRFVNCVGPNFKIRGSELYGD